ncbi:MAG: sugar phosphate isomerase/epimerase family protein [Anaerolineae bacterium]
MPKYGAHTFLWIDEWTTEKGNWAIAATAEVGFDFIEISLLKPEEFDSAAHKKALAEAGIEATGSLVLPEWAHMPEEPEKAKQFLISALNKLADVGGTYLCGCTAFALGKFTGERQMVVDTLGEVAEEAKKRGITLGIEVVNRYESHLFNTLADTRETILAIGAENIVVHADTYHMNIEEEGFYKPLVECADVLGYMHMSENHRGLLGSGTVNWDEVFRGLADAHYEGPLVVKSFPAVNPALAAAIKLWRPPTQPSEFLAREGLKFLKEYSERYGLD